MADEKRFVYLGSYFIGPNGDVEKFLGGVPVELKETETVVRRTGPGKYAFDAVEVKADISKRVI